MIAVVWLQINFKLLEFKKKYTQIASIAILNTNTIARDTNDNYQFN